jgi:dTDP-4-amino-4,6-dideoxygalactose transaminase
MPIPFHRALITGSENSHILQATKEAQFSGNGPMTRRCQDWLSQACGAPVVLTPSGTASLDMMALMLDLKPGDEVILPSFTFVATASAFALRGVVPVYVDVRRDTLNIDETLVPLAITPKTKAIIPIHYGGVAANLDALSHIATDHQVMLLEDSAQCLLAKYKGRPLGTFGTLGTLSFHATKNLHCGEGGALIINDPKFHLKAEIVREKGTNRSQFFRGEVDKYTWVDLGSAYCPSELDAAFLMGQLEHAEVVTTERVRMWKRYHSALHELEQRGILRRPFLPSECETNAHIFFVVLPSLEKKNSLFEFMKSKQIGVSSHYVPLHSSPAGKKYGRGVGSFKNTDEAFDGLLRLPLWHGLGSDQDQVIEAIFEWAK